MFWMDMHTHTHARTHTDNVLEGGFVFMMTNRPTVQNSKDDSHQGYSGVYCLRDRLMMEAVRRLISKMSVYFDDTTRRCIPGYCNLYTRGHENLKPP
jgi:hypothetical protein